MRRMRRARLLPEYRVGFRIERDTRWERVLRRQPVGQGKDSCASLPSITIGKLTMSLGIASKVCAFMCVCVCNLEERKGIYLHEERGSPCSREGSSCHSR